MAATGFTPISLYYSSTSSAVPSAGNLANGELGLNIADMKLYAKNSAGAVTLLASASASNPVTTISFGSTGLTPSTATSGAVTVAGTLAVANGGTGQTTASAAFNALSPITTTGDLILGNGTNSATRLAIGANGYVLQSNGTTASWQPNTGGVTSFQTSLSGLTPSTSTTGAVTLAGTLGATSGGTSQTAYTTGDLLYASATNTLSKLAIGAANYVLTSNGTTVSWAAASGAQAGGVIYENGVTISSNYTLTTNKNGLSVGPITINSGVAVTVPSGQRWVIL